jgi:hypothetical protein
MRTSKGRESKGERAMKNMGTLTKIVVAVVLSTGCYVLLASAAWSHCDTAGGPVIPEAKAALEKGDVTAVLKWVKKENEPEIKAAFAKAVAVRAKGPEAKELTDQYFIETLVRLHRAGEGAPYTGIKEEPVEPIVAMADRALAEGSADHMIKELGGHMAKAVREKFNKAVEAKKSKDKSVEAGREFVEAYVVYVHYVEGIHTAIVSAGSHHHGGATPSAALATAEHGEHKD